MATAYVSFQAEIYAHTLEQLIGAVAAQIAEKATEVHLLLSCPGGDPAEALGAYHVLRGLPIRLITHNVGRVASAANSVFLAGELRYACRLSNFHYHRALYDLREAGKVDKHQLKEFLDMMLSDDASLHAIMGERTTLPPSEVQRMLVEGAVIDPDAALAAGIIHEIREVDVPPDARFIQLAYRRPWK